VTRQVVVKARARFDVRIMVLWFQANRSAAAAARWNAGIIAAIEGLAHEADQWPEAHEAIKLGQDLRCKLFRRWRHVYRILFTIDGETVNVHRIRHAAQDDIAEDDI
jgi:plasmid stabilization system protein ParE